MDELKLTKEQQEMIDAFTTALPKLRKEIGISQNQLGEKIGISRQMVSLIERRVNPMTWSTFLSIALFFKVNYGRDKKNLNDLDRFLLIDPLKK
ncbi:MAG: helix-turn-helix transcriptional regulator [Clostridiales Family XIII bacterium]|nr:helix-turn-helix transcriptional regulator [Clostridiales Family XIII bacterium]